MVTISDNLVKEFKRNIRMGQRGFNPNPPLPKGVGDVMDYSGVYLVKGVPENEEYFSKLNNTVVYGVKDNQKPSKRVIMSTGEVKRDSNGSIVREPVTVSKGVIPIISPISLGLPYSKKGVEGEFGYVDFFETPQRGGKIDRQFMYLVGDKYLYPFNQIALVYSNKRLAKTYITIRVVTWKHGVVYLSLIPYENNTYKKAKVLAKGFINSFTNVIPNILQHWISTGFVVNPSFFAQSDEGDEFIIKSLEGVLEAPDSMVSDVSVAEKRGKEVVDEENLLNL